MDDAIDHAMGAHEVRVSVLGKLLVNRLLDHAWPGEANQRARLSKSDIAEQGETGR